MSDQERAESWLIDWLDWLPASERDRFTRDLTEQLRFVRLDERTAVASYLLQRALDVSAAQSGERRSLALALLTDEADRINRGEHEKAAERRGQQAARSGR